MEINLVEALAVPAAKHGRGVLAILNEKHYYPVHPDCIWRARGSNQAGGLGSALQEPTP